MYSPKHYRQIVTIPMGENPTTSDPSNWACICIESECHRLLSALSVYNCNYTGDIRFHINFACNPTLLACHKSIILVCSQPQCGYRELYRSSCTSSHYLSHIIMIMSLEHTLRACTGYWGHDQDIKGWMNLQTLQSLRGKSWRKKKEIQLNKRAMRINQRSISDHFTVQ